MIETEAESIGRMSSSNDDKHVERTDHLHQK